MNKEHDTETRRSKITKQIFKEAMLDLLDKKPLTKISVRELCLEADLNRSTFYDHYIDLDDLIEDMENELIEQIRILVDKRIQNVENPYNSFLAFIRYFEEHSRLSILIAKNSTKFLDHAINTTIKSSMFTDNYKPNAEVFKYNVSFKIAGTEKVILEWLETPDHMSTEEMTDLLIKLFGKIID